MNSRQRFLNTVAGEPVDRPPLAPFIHVNFVKEYRQAQDLDLVAETAAVYRELGFDMVHRNCTPAYDDFTIEGPDWCPRTVVQRVGQGTQTTVTVRTPGGDLRRVIRSDTLYEFEASNFLVEPPIQSSADFDLFVRYLPPVPRIDVRDIGRARQLVGEDGVVAPWSQEAFNEVCFSFRGHALLLDALDDEGFYRAMLEYFLKRNLVKQAQLVAGGADFLCLGGNEANGAAVGPAYFEQYVLEYEVRLMAALHAAGGRAIYHNCGKAAKLLPLLPRIGMDVYESLTPPPFGDTLLADAMARMPGLPLMGGLDQIEFLRKATPAAVKEQTRKLLGLAQRHGRFIVGTSDYFNERTPRANLWAMREAVDRIG
jgi:uroporphyrinogen decarboxylase